MSEHYPRIVTCVLIDVIDSHFTLVYEHVSSSPSIANTGLIHGGPWALLRGQ